ncbi:MAG TPA: hypothetical protein VER37_07230 [Thermomicrobiales bacterium]|nr:hypothetical protein [Thermomicrobiales bacterium]
MLRSQLALELALSALAVVAGLALLRAVIHAIGIAEQTWTASFLDAATDPLVRPLQLIPGGSRSVVGQASLADLTTAVLLLVVPAFFLSRPPRA